MTRELWNQWVSDWQRILEVADKRGWSTKPLVIEPPANRFEVEEIEQQIGMALPEDFKEVVTKFSRHVDFEWNRANSPDSDSIFPNASSGGRTYKSGLWNLDQLVEMVGVSRTESDMHQDFFEKYQEDYDAISMEHLKRFVPFIRVTNGDDIGFLIEPNGGYWIHFYIHDDICDWDYCLGSSFVEFITRWSAIGCVGPEYWYLEPDFYDNDKGELRKSGGRVAEWKGYLYD